MQRLNRRNLFADFARGYHAGDTARNALADAVPAPAPTPAPAYNALAEYGGPTRVAAEVAYGPSPYADEDWTRGRVEGVDPRLIEILSLVRDETGVPFYVTEGMRDAERQRRLVAQGASQTMNSRHLHGNALDIAIPDGRGGVNWDFDAYVPLGAAAKAAAERLGYNGFVWGGDWKSLRDGVHFQLG